MECPNSCGTNNLQHQHLEEHVSTQCPLSYVECEFSDAGCDDKVYRKDLPSHLGENMVTHMSLLARENRRQKLQIQDQQLQLAQLKIQLKEQEEQTISRAHLDVPPLVFCLAINDLKQHMPWCSDSFYSHVGGYKLHLEMKFEALKLKFRYACEYNECRDLPPPRLHITTVILDQETGKYTRTFSQKIETYDNRYMKRFNVYSFETLEYANVEKFGRLLVRVAKIDLF